ncbi:dethiobiotin synthase [Dermatophilus congolensis]|uniref:dethiobiotin synthase n=1 Tax=Dermatophilus congolensis TaxID=1863 RepID=UPI001AAE7E7E|nr:dethiobiotin synthase [Dermatophilus congolensis]MBO3131933.1 dethiobiotin synthase [Dermatophilus congolensis]MBO3133910.1 dethiobiotin synthase [Dermatophilus congolensis]MBO3136141.1 dethiobiotin synthase [Dermatophilus congolensis]MBO3138385.1 dethiobiotin synthase [Dermatophilus congolensis]
MSRVVVVTGTDTDVGKTVVTAALVASVRACGGRVAVDKPTQTGVVPGQEGDVQVVARLSGVECLSEGVRLVAPMAPVQAAAREGVCLPSLGAHVERIAGLAAQCDVVFVEGAGGVLVELDGEHGTVADLVCALGESCPDVECEVVVVARADLGTLNHTELTLEALLARGIRVRGVVIGAWPDDPGPIAEDNRRHIAGLGDSHRYGVPLLGVVPVGAGAWERERFCAAASEWFGCAL